DAVFTLGEDDLVAVVNRVEALQSFLATDDGENLLAGYKRAANILKAEAKKGELPTDEPNKGTQKEETDLFKAIEAAKPKIDTALEKEDYAGAMTALSKLRRPIDAFFDEVTVNSDNDQERQNRLGLLIEIRKTARTMADFNKIEG
ncbi:MAG: glycine--tRNA ligase subunit beta, partial [Acidimicrobiales bacterium]